MTLFFGFKVRIGPEGDSLLWFLLSREFCSIFGFSFQFLVDLALFCGIICVWWRIERFGRKA